MAERSARTRLWIVIVLLAAGAAVLWGASRLVWESEAIDAGVRGTIDTQQRGAELQPALVPVAVLALAGIAGVVATSGWARRALCFVLGVAGGAAGALAVRAAAQSGSLGFGPVLALAGGLLVLLAALLGLRWARQLPRLGGRYERSTTRSVRTDEPEDMWKALSDGDDPTSPG